MTAPQCEFCGQPPVWRARYRRDDYERFACKDHVMDVRRLVFIDMGVRTGFDPTHTDEGGE